MSVAKEDFIDLETIDRIVEIASKKKIEPFEVICPGCGKSWRAYCFWPPSEEGHPWPPVDGRLFEHPIEAPCDKCGGGGKWGRARLVRAKE